MGTIKRIWGVVCVCATMVACGSATPSSEQSPQLPCAEAQPGTPAFLTKVSMRSNGNVEGEVSTPERLDVPTQAPEVDRTYPRHQVLAHPRTTATIRFRNPPLRQTTVLFRDMMDSHWMHSYFPTVGAMPVNLIFKYIYEKLATSHDLFKRYSRFYCGVSGSIVKPGGERYDVVKIKDANGQCIVGKYHRCCWPCSCDIMKHARAEQVTMALPNDTTQAQGTYWVLTIDDPCGKCDVLPCPDLPREVTAFDCGGGVTRNGLRVKDGSLTEGADGRLIFAVLMDAEPASETSATVDVDLMRMCQRRIDATPAVLDTLGGMGDIFVKLALVNTNETFTNSNADLCE